MAKAARQPSLFDDALNPTPAAPLAEAHEPRPQLLRIFRGCFIEIQRELGAITKRPHIPNA